MVLMQRSLWQHFAKRWQTRVSCWSEVSTMTTSVELVVIGAGPGGYACAFRAADLGMKVAIVEPRAQLGGVCLNEGCIPSKALLHSAEIIKEAHHMRDWGLDFGQPKIDLDKLRAKKDEIVGSLTQG